MRRGSKTILGLSVLLVSSLSPFQNCSKVDFKSAAKGLNSPADTSPRYKDLVVSVSTTAPKLDVLFMVDESVSMREVIDSLTAGFESIAAGSYPPDTLMAVSNTAPALIDQNGNDQFDTSYVNTNGAPRGRVSAQPGFLRLVSQMTINSFLDAFPSYANAFPRRGCSEWFRPDEKNADNIPCLTAASQIAEIGIGVESGLHTFGQLVRRFTSAGNKLFRDEAAAHVIYVSDTHDPGVQNFYGLPGAPAQPASFSQLQNYVLANNNKIVSIRFSAITPLPPAGDARLDGITTVGNLPASLNESKVSSEDLYDFSYLPVVKDSNGVAAHIVGNDWSLVLNEIVAEIALIRDYIVSLQEPAKSIVSISLGGKELTADEYQLSDDGNTLILKLPGRSATNAQLNLRYELK